MLGVYESVMKRIGHKTFAAYSRYLDVNKESLTQANKQWDDLAAKELKEPEETYKIAS